MSNMPVISHTFKYGDKNDNVKLLQRCIRESVINPLVIDGDFGPNTLSCLIDWQKKLSLNPNGLYEGETKSLIDTYISQRFIQEWCYEHVANTLGRNVNDFTALAKAISSVESRKEGFMPDGYVTLLFERHKFRQQLLSRLKQKPNEINVIESFYKVKLIDPTATGAVNYVEKTNPDICNVVSGGYLSGNREKARFQTAMNLNPFAAANSASFGLYQIMGFNAIYCGYNSGYDMLLWFMKSEYYHLLAFGKFLESNPIIYLHLKNKDYVGIAKLYNGPGYAKNNYHVKLKNALAIYGY